MTNLREREITDKLSAVRRSISDTCYLIGRQIPRLIAVSKMHPVEAMLIAYRSGQREFGENYSQELAQKRAALSEFNDLKLVFIGRLQSNKIKTIVSNADEIQALASEKHAGLIARAATDLGKTPYPVYYLVNVGNEDSKDGLQLSEVPTFDQIVAKKYPELSVQGLMAIPPPLESDQTGAVPGLYAELRDLASKTGAGKLSLGMSADLSLAIKAGTDCVRIGTAIFGERL